MWKKFSSLVILFTLPLGWVPQAWGAERIVPGKDNVENLVSQEYGDELIGYYFKFFHYVDLHPFFDISAQNPSLNKVRYKFSELEGRKRDIKFNRPGFYGEKVLDIFSNRSIREQFGTKTVERVPPPEYDISTLEAEFSTKMEDLPIVEEDLSWSHKDEFTHYLITEPSLIARSVTGAKDRAVHADGAFALGDIQVGVDSYSKPGESLKLRFRGFWNNEERLYRTRFIPTDFLIESRTPHALINLGDNTPDFSSYSFNNHFFGLYGIKNFYHTNLYAGVGLKNFLTSNTNSLPAVVQGVRLEHYIDRIYRVGFNYSNSIDRTDLPHVNALLPPLRNQLFSFDAKISPTRDLNLDFEYAGSRTDFNTLDTVGDLFDSAVKFIGKFTYNRYEVETGFERAGSQFFSGNGYSPRDEESVYQNFKLTLNRYFETRVAAKYARDNIDGNKVRTTTHAVPRALLRIHPSEYYPFLRIDLTVEPKTIYSNDNVIDQDHGLGQIEFFQKVGDFEMDGGYGVNHFDDKFNNLNDRNSTQFNWGTTWFQPQKRGSARFGASLLKDHFVTQNRFDRTTQFEFGGTRIFSDDVRVRVDFKFRTVNLGLPSADHFNRNVTLRLNKPYFKDSSLDFSAAYNLFDYENNALSYADHFAKVSWRHEF